MASPSEQHRMMERLAYDMKTEELRLARLDRLAEQAVADAAYSFRKWEDEFIAANLRLATEPFDYGTPIPRKSDLPVRAARAFFFFMMGFAAFVSLLILVILAAA